MLSWGEQTTTTFVIILETAIVGRSHPVCRETVSKIALGNDAVDGLAIAAYNHSPDLVGV